MALSAEALCSEGPERDSSSCKELQSAIFENCCLAVDKRLPVAWSAAFSPFDEKQPLTIHLVSFSILHHSEKEHALDKLLALLLPQ